MYQSKAMEASVANGTSPLFPCTKCKTRHPFEELSVDSQLCKSCKSPQMIKCHYCRSEFYPEGNGKAGSICKKCQQLADQHGKPRACVYCNIIAAFIGSKCQRCTNSEKKHGPPLTCENCKQKSAFDRNDVESLKKVDGKFLCWLCTMSYKRSLAKARHKEALLSCSTFYGATRKGVADGGDSQSRRSHHSSSSKSHNHYKHNFQSSGGGGETGSSIKSSHRHSQSLGLKDSSASSKKMRKDYSAASNGHLSATSGMSFSIQQTVSSDHELVVTQLKEQLADLSKRLQIKERELLTKDQQIAELKANNVREQRDMREKINVLQRENDNRQNEMQIKLIEIQKQYSAMTRAKKVSRPDKNEIPSVI